MSSALLNKIFGSRNERLIKRLYKQVEKINALEPQMQKLSDEELTAYTNHFKKRLADKASLDDILYEAFAVVREASQRVFGLRHFDVQLIGGIVLHQGKIAEMGTGEGKTLVATLAAYLNALTEKGVHIITVNDYLANRDAEDMGRLYRFLGLSTGVVVADMSNEKRREAYACDITYGTNNEFGFDYLRDNMAFSLEEQVQRQPNFVVIDEVDSILIDEARTPLIISGASDESSELYHLFNRLMPYLTLQKSEGDEGDYYVDEKAKQAYLTENGHNKIESMLIDEGIIGEDENLYSPQHVTKMYYLNASLRAHALYYKDVDYIVRDGQVIIIDEHTGRPMEGRRWSDGLHQAMEAKEGVEIQGENQTLASITFQNFFKLYNKVAGMTGTADTEASEFHSIYNLEVVVVPPNVPRQRTDHPDAVYLTKEEKYKAIVEDIQNRQNNGQPVLVGTASIDTSEVLSKRLKQHQIKHDVLNAKQPEKEAYIIAQAGQPGKVTIATNMAGRGTDIILGGNWKFEVDALENPTQEQIDKIKADWKKRHQQVVNAGGLSIIGSERHESRRIDNQLRGRCARQGDPGETQFYLSMEDDLVRIFAPQRMSNMLKRLGMGEGEAIESSMVSKSIAKAQHKVETYHFDIRKNLLEFDNVTNEQRKIIYALRQEVMGSDDHKKRIEDMRSRVVDNITKTYIPPESLEEQWQVEALQQTLAEDFDIHIDLVGEVESAEEMDDQMLRQHVSQTIFDHYENKMADVDTETIRHFEKVVLLQSLDTHWRDQLSNMEHLRQSINLKSYAQRNPKQEYKRESYQLYAQMLEDFEYDVITTIAKVNVASPEETEQVEERWRQSISNMEAEHQSVLTGGSYQDQQSGSSDDAEAEKKNQPYVRQGRKIKRNELCPCGSGKKYKHCHGSLNNTA